MHMVGLGRKPLRASSCTLAGLAAVMLLTACGVQTTVTLYQTPPSAPKQALAGPTGTAMPTRSAAALATPTTRSPVATIRTYVAALARGYAERAWALTGPHWRQQYPKGQWRQMLSHPQPLQFVSATETAQSRAQQAAARAQRREYMVELDVSGSNLGAWNHGRNTRFFGVLRATGGWQVDSVASAPGYIRGELSGGRATSARSTGGCASREVCNRTLGIALHLPAGWEAAPAGHYPASDLVLWRTPATGQETAVERLIIRPLGTTTDANDARAAAAEADRELQANPSPAATHRRTVRYAGVEGVLLRGVPSNGPVAEITLAHQGSLYRILAPGTALSVNQQQVLASLRFIPHAKP